MLPGYLTSDEAAAHLGITRRTLYVLAERSNGFPEPQRIGRTLLWSQDGLDTWRADHPARRKTCPQQTETSNTEQKNSH
ncbi:helix-turn-helix transcriptional regulator [Actinoplanes solisilvae]|uniref:helix-turn-helix transcriptional regulator n=1 Tax=Actinoplanes solisilvae TaxID=2486853 RepID=UPI00196B3850|nr:helix-turn-helix domain-containing protein [Actinoplanes solisilvae]